MCLKYIAALLEYSLQRRLCIRSHLVYIYMHPSTNHMNLQASYDAKTIIELLSLQNEFSILLKVFW